MTGRITNPYTPRATTDNPVGRDAPIRRINQAIAPVLANGHAAPGGVILYGVRGIGKTSILRSIQANSTSYEGFITTWTSAAKRTSYLASLPGAIRSSLINAGIVNPKEWSLESLGVELGLTGLKANAKFNKDTGSAPVVTWDVNNVEQLIRSTAKLCRSHGNNKGTGFLLFIDELHAIKQQELSILLNAFQNISDDKLDSPPFMFLGAGLPNVRGIATMAATFGERTLFEKIDALSGPDVKMAIMEPALTRDVSVAADVLERIVAYANGYPFFVQLYGYNMWDVADPRAGDTITMKDAEQSFKVTKNDILDVFTARYQATTKKELEYISIMAQLAGDESIKRQEIAEALDKKTGDISMLRQQLISKAIITEDNHGFTRFTMPGFADFILKHN